jgi:hypothetical protein
VYNLCDVDRLWKDAWIEDWISNWITTGTSWEELAPKKEMGSYPTPILTCAQRSHTGQK